MASFLPNNMDNLVLIGGAILSFIGIGLTLTGISIRRNDKVAFIRRKCQELNIPIIKLIDSAGHGISILGEINEENPIYFKDEKLSMRVRPSFLDEAEPWYDDGIKTYLYTGNWYYPVGPLTQKTLTQIVDRTYELFPELSFIDNELDIILLMIVYDGKALQYNCKMILEEYEQEEYLLYNGEPVVDTVLEPSQLTYTDEYDNEEYALDAIIYNKVPKTDDKGNYIYKKNPQKFSSVNSFIETVKRAKSIVLSEDIRPGFINMKRATKLVPGRADGHRIDNLIKLAEKRRDIMNAVKEKWAQYLMYASAFVFVGIAACYLIWILIGKVG